MFEFWQDKGQKAGFGNGASKIEKEKGARITVSQTKTVTYYVPIWSENWE
jgi:hypothetical protein